jgi:hypothetical protein
LLALALLLPALCPAAETCQWLNAATAGRILGGPSTLDVTHPANRDDAVCTFKLQRGGAAELRIEVMTMETPRTEFTAHAEQCGADSAPLTGIGNEAVVCSKPHAARVVGRVRNRIFVVQFTAGDSPAAAAEMRDKAREVAETVAGNLF